MLYYQHSLGPSGVLSLATSPVLSQVGVRGIVGVELLCGQAGFWFSDTSIEFGELDKLVSCNLLSSSRF